MKEIRKSFDTTWDFREANTKILTHCFHSYPAMMIPQVAGRLIEKYGKKAKLLFDPFCGTGTSLVEAIIRNINAIGTDLNPLARLIAKAKTTPIKIQTLDLYLRDFNEYIFCHRFSTNNSRSIVSPVFKNIDYWFATDVQEKLTIIDGYIRNIEEQDVKQFFKVAFSETIREVSWTRNNEFKLYRMSERQIAVFAPDVFGLMENKLARNRNGLISFMNAKTNCSTKIFDFNSVEKIPEEIIKEESVDLVVTSPPYGDSRTTVAYGQFSRLANQWMGYDGASLLDNQLMGGKRTDEVKNFRSNILNEVIQIILDKDNKRVKDVISFYSDYYKSIKNVSKVIRTGGFACYVVGNRRVKGVTVPTDEITMDFFSANGFKHIETIIRNIPNKRMPSKNSPSNIPGQLDKTMSNEYIVVMQKPRSWKFFGRRS